MSPSRTHMREWRQYLKLLRAYQEAEREFQNSIYPEYDIKLNEFNNRYPDHEPKYVSYGLPSTPPFDWVLAEITDALNLNHGEVYSFPWTYSVGPHDTVSFERCELDDADAVAFLRAPEQANARKPKRRSQKSDLLIFGCPGPVGLTHGEMVIAADRLRPYRFYGGIRQSRSGKTWNVWRVKRTYLRFGS